MAQSLRFDFRSYKAGLGHPAMDDYNGRDMMHPFFRDLTPTLHISHRGGARIAPENTLVAFRLAVGRFRTDMLEIDVRATADGELVVFHDADLDRTTDVVGLVSEHRLSEIATVDAGFRFTRNESDYPFRGKGIRIPLLRDVLEAFPAMLFNIELKDDIPSIEDAFADVIRRTGTIQKVCVGSHDDAVSGRLLRALPDACHFYPRGAATNVIIGFQAGQELRDEAPYHVLDMPLYYGGARLLDPQFLFRAAQSSKWVNVWTVDNRREMDRLIREGVGGIMTDRPDVLRDALDRPSAA